MKRLLFLTLLLGLAACRPKTPAPVDEASRVQAAAAATLTALPVPTLCPSPLPPPTPAPSPTPDLRGLFCEYDFCLGHPADSAFFDALVIREEHRPSDYAYGILVSYQPNFYQQVNWSTLAGEADPYAMLAVTVGDDVVDMNNLQVESLNGWIVTYAPLLKTASPEVLPYGLAASWTCGDREFGWKAYTASEAQARGLLEQTLARFDCAVNR